MDLEQRVEQLEKRVEYLEQVIKTQQQPTPRFATEKKPVRPVIPQQIKKPEIPAAKKDLESFIGKNVFVIVASVLIFIGVIVFASVLLPYLTQPVKFALMCIASIGFTGFSYWLINRKKNTLTIAILACGLGTIYITIFTGNLYFKIINDIILYIALAVWVLMVYFCSKYKTFLFNIIGQIGILLSLILGIADAITNGKESFILFALIFVAIAEILYIILFKAKGFIINACSALTAVFILSISIILDFQQTFSYTAQITINEMFMNKNGNLLEFILLNIFFGYIVIQNIIMCKLNKISTKHYPIISFAELFIGFVMLVLFKDNILSQLIVITTVILLFIATEWIFYTKERHILVTVLSTIYLCTALLLYYSVFEKLWITGMIFMIPVMFYLYRTKTSCNKMIGVIGLGISTLLNIAYCSSNSSKIFVNTADYVTDTYTFAFSWQNFAYFLSCAIIAATFYWFVRHQEKNETSNMLLYLFIIGNIFITFAAVNEYYSFSFEDYSFKYMYEVTILLKMLLAVIIQTFFRFNGLFETREDMFKQKTFTAYFIVNAVMMLTFITNLYDIDECIPAYIIGAIIATILFTLNTTTLMQKQDSKMSAYVGIKLAILITVIFHIFEIQPLTSILWFCWAVACIVIGLKLKQKPLRIFALILALISAAKLILVDISYDNILSRAFSFIICGVLCFVISYIYHRIEKANTQENSIL